MSEPTSGSPAAQDSASVSPLVFLDYNCFQREPTDYVDVSRRLYAGQSIDEIFERAEKQWLG